ncbi:ABC transporter ATP-binding protein [Virgibacillus ihumii]|uniref:ABC transporter ATP-binding protein n=1 Tax=Virgibacillus ihumii TaxID=2686091 RepID=UPI00157E0D66|nr:ATP-binding cassette domain-containing protein [Virgibacillus ihumii]
MSFLTLDNISHHYFAKKSFTKALDNVSCKINEGEITALLGQSGCGKSTLLSIISGIIQPTEGNILLDLKPLKQTDYTIGYMLEKDYLFSWKSIMDNVLVGPKISGQLSDYTRQKAVDLLRDVGVPDVGNYYPDSLSAEMRQRVALVRTLIMDPKILLLDEPFSATDYREKRKLEDVFSKMLKSCHKTTLLATNDMEEAICMSDRIIVMAPNPGTAARTFNVPIELREERPFLVRRHPKYQLLFDKIWEVFESFDKAVWP